MRLIKETIVAPTLELLVEKMDAYSDKYPFAGYGTSFSDPKQNDMTNEWYVHVRKNDSCD